jgi:subtilisin-like proprotein convertase family protein
MTPRKILVLVSAAALAAGAASAQWNHTYTDFTNQPIPSSGTGGAAGGISNPANATSFSLNVPIALVLTHVTVEAGINHSNTGDLRIEVSHCGVSVILYNQSPPAAADLSGIYHFSDSAMTSFASAVNSAPWNGWVPTGTYTPLQPLSAFNGMSSAGTWTVTVYDLANNSTGSLTEFGVSLISFETWVGGGNVVPIPDGANGQCLAPVTTVINVGSHAIVSDTVVRLNFQHTYVSDLDITVSHGGVSVALSQWNAPISSANVQGIYGFWDGAAMAWTTAEASYSGTSTIPSVTYRPAQPLSVFSGLDQYGPWYITVCDRSAMDVGTIATVFLEVSHAAYNLALTQPNGPAAITLTNSGGVPGHAFVNLFTLQQGSAPFGWIAGLDIAFADLVYQVGFGPPFTGVIGPCGVTAVTINGPIPSGLTVWGASFELDSSLSPVATKTVFTYTTAP